MSVPNEPLGKPIRVLVVDDDDVDREKVFRLLQKIPLPLEIVEAASGQNASKLLEEQAFDCAILDYRLPDMLGTELLHAVQKHRDEPSPIIMISGLGDERIAADSMREGVYDYLPKHALKYDQLHAALEGGLRWAKSQRELIDAQNRFRHLADGLPQLVWTCTADGIYDFFSSQWEHYTGIPASEQLGALWAKQVHPDDLEALLDAWALTLAEGSSLRIDIRLRRHDGEYRLFDTRAIPQRDAAGNILRWIGSNTDITEIAAERQARAESDARSHQIFATNPHAMLVINAQGIVVEANQQASQTFGYAAETLIGLPAEVLVPSYPAEASRISRDAFAENQISRETEPSGVLKAVRADQVEFPIKISLGPITVQGQPFLVATVADLTEQEAAQIALQESQQRLILSTQANEIGLWELLLPTKQLVWDETMFRLHGRQSLEFSGEYSEWRNFVHPDDLSGAEIAIQSAIDNNLPIEQDFRVITAAGEIRHLFAKAAVFYAPSGEALRVLGTCLDITERKRQEVELRNTLHEKETLLREVYHRVKNNLQVVGSLFNLQLRSLPDGEGKTALADGAARVQSMALVHEKLYQSSSLSSVDLGSYVRDLCAHLWNLNNADKRLVTLQLRCDVLSVDLEIAVPLGLLLNELITNSLKHAFRTEQGGTITIRLTYENQYGVLEVIDDGVGFDEAALDPAKLSLGLRLVESLTAQLDGKYARQTIGGVATRIRFPLMATGSQRARS